MISTSPQPTERLFNFTADFFGYESEIYDQTKEFIVLVSGNEEKIRKFKEKKYSDPYKPITRESLIELFGLFGIEILPDNFKESFPGDVLIECKYNSIFKRKRFRKFIRSFLPWCCISVFIKFDEVDPISFARERQNVILAEKEGKG